LGDRRASGLQKFLRQQTLQLCLGRPFFLIWSGTRKMGQYQLTPVYLENGRQTVMMNLCLQPGLDLPTYLSDKSASLTKKNCGQLQPHVLLLSDSQGDPANDQTVYAVIQGGLFYEMSSVVEAVDVCIKACFVFGLKFPEPAKSSWTFMQKAVFGITDVGDFSSNRLLELLSSIN